MMYSNIGLSFRETLPLKGKVSPDYICLKMVPMVGKALKSTPDAQRLK